MPDRVIVFGVDSPIGLAVCRDLHRHGVEVYAIGRNRYSLGLHSRAIAWGTVYTGPPEATVPFVRDIARRFGIDKLMAISEPDILLFNAARDDVAELEMLFPPADKMTLVLDKRRTLELARTLGIDTPRTWDIHDLSAIEPIARDAVFPVVLKWPDPNAVFGRLASHGLPFRKIEFCLDAASLRTALAFYAPAGCFPLVQEYARGVGVGQMVVMHKGKAVLKFQHRRLHEWPPEGGFATTCISLSVDRYPTVMEKSIALLRAIGWEGAAMVEYRYDSTAERFVLMEVNGRFWGSLPLACHAGASFPWYQYSVMGKHEVPASSPYRPGVRCTYMVPEIKRLLRLLFRPDAIGDPTFRYSIGAEIRDFAAMIFRPGQRYYVFDLRDPMPLLHDLLGMSMTCVERLIEFGRRTR